MGGRSGVLSNFPDRFARSAARDADQDAVYYHHAAGREIVRKAWDDPLTGEAGGSTFYGGDLDGISEKLPYLKQLGVTALYLNPVFAAPACINTIPRIIGASIRSLAATRRCSGCATTPSGRECA